MKRLTFVFPVIAFAAFAAGCKNGVSGNPDVTAKATNSGADLLLVWATVEGASEYTIYGDGNEIATTSDTSYTISGGANSVYAEVKVCANGNENCTSVDLRPWSGQVTNLCYSTESGCPSWVKIDFGGPSLNALQQADVDPNAPNTGYFIIYSDGSVVQFQDASETSKGQAKMELAFTDNTTSSFAPPSGSYNTIRDVSQDGTYIFWADNTSTGYGNMDENDYFGVVKVDNLSNTDTDLTIYVQDKVPGLRWLKK